MANTRISNLTASASNLAATDVTPVVQTTGVGPVKMTGLQIAGGLLGSTALTGATITTSQPVLNLSQTWNDGAGGTVTFTGLRFNATDTASASGSLLLDLQVGGVSKANITKGGRFYSDVDTSAVAAVSYALKTGVTTGFGGYYDSPALISNGAERLWANSGGVFVTTNTKLWLPTSTFISFNDDLILRRAAAATLQLGAADAAAPVAQTFKVQSVVAGTTNTAGTNFTIQGSAGTGTGAGGSIIFQVAPAGSSGSSQNAYVTAMGLNAVAGSSPYAIFEVGAASGYNGVQIRTGGYTGGACFVGDTPTQGTVFGVHPAFAFAWSNGNATPTATYDLFVRRDAANTLALRNGASAQLFRVYSTYNGTNDAYGAIGAAVNLDGTAGNANTLYIGSQKKGSPTALTKLAIQVDGTTRADFGITYTDNWTFTNPSSGAFNILGSGSGNSNFGLAIQAGAGSQDYSLYITNSAGTTPYFRIVGNTGIVCFGTNTSSFPALKRVSANLQVIAADNTASAGFIVGNQALATSATDGFLYVPTCAGTPTGTPTTQTGTAPIVVDSTNNKLYFYSGGQWRDAGP
jgi:hypothetical protein